MTDAQPLIDFTKRQIDLLEKSSSQIDEAIKAASQAIEVAEKFQDLFIESAKLLLKVYPTSSSLEIRNEIEEFLLKNIK